MKTTLYSHRIGSYVIVAIAALATGLFFGQVACHHGIPRTDWPTAPVPHPRSINSRTQTSQ